MALFEWVVFVYTILLVLCVHQAGHVVSIERVGLTARKFKVGVCELLSFRLRWFFPRTQIVLGALPLGVWKQLSDESNRHFPELSYEDRAFVHCAGGIVNILFGLLGYVVYLLMHSRLPWKLDTILVLFVFIAVYTLRRWIGAYLLPLMWLFVVRLLAHAYGRGELSLDLSWTSIVSFVNKLVHELHHVDVWVITLATLSLSFGIVSLTPIPYVTDGGEILKDVFRPLRRRFLPQMKIGISLRHLHALRNMQN